MVKMRRFAKKVTAVTLSSVLTASMIPMPVFAAEDVDHPVIVYDEDGGEYGNVTVEAEATAVMVFAMNDDAKVTTGDVTNGDGYGVVAVEMGGNESEVNTGSITSITSDGLATGLMSYGDEKGSVVANVDGDITAGQRGVNISNMGGNTSVEVTGYVFGEKSGIETISYSGGDNNVTVGGDVLSSKTAVSSLTSTGSKSNIVIGGNVEAGKNAVESGVHEGSDSNITVMGNISGDETGIAMYTQSDSRNNVKVGGDVKGEECGVVITRSEDGATNNILIEGTLEGGEIGIAYPDKTPGGEENDLSDTTLTVWKIEKNENGAVAGKETEEGECEQDEDFEKNNIQYIIKVGQPAAGATLKATGEGGAALATVEGVTDTWSVAKEGETVLLKIDIQDGYALTGAYGDEGRTLALLRDADGNYYIEVPKGGGVYLSVTLDRIIDNGNKDEEEGKSTSKEEENSYAVFNASVIQMISSAAPGANVMIVAAGWTGLDKAVADALALRPDISLTIRFVLDGIMYEVTIPAGTNIDALRNESGGIDFITLAGLFGARPV